MYSVNIKFQNDGKIQNIKLPTAYTSRKSAIIGGKKFVSSSGIRNGEIYVKTINGRSSFSNPRFSYSEWDEVKEDMIYKGNKLTIPKAIALFKDECKCPYAYELSSREIKVAADREFLKWAVDYWVYICQNDRNHAGYYELGGSNLMPYLFFINCLNGYQYKVVSAELTEYSKFDSNAAGILNRLKKFHQKYC